MRDRIASESKSADHTLALTYQFAHNNALVFFDPHRWSEQTNNRHVIVMRLNQRDVALIKQDNRTIRLFYSGLDHGEVSVPYPGHTIYGIPRDEAKPRSGRYAGWDRNS